MDLSDWRRLTVEEQKKRSGELDPYGRDPLFDQIEAAFREEHGNQEGVAEVFCGMGPGVGPYVGIFVTIQRGCPRVRLPKVYLGFSVFRCYQKPNGEVRSS